ncbi:hypothetical protein ACWDUN_28540 [Mycobacterium sp. NPDC003323]
MKPLLVLAAAALLTAGCGGSEPTATTQTASPTGIPAMTDRQDPPDRVVIDVTIERGQVSPTNQQIQASVGQPILVRVSSDAPDELHVHASPEHTFEVKAEPLQSFQFTVEVPGKVDVELHDAHRVVATVTVQ